MEPFMVRHTTNVRLIRYLDNHPGDNEISQIARQLQLDRHTITAHLTELQQLIATNFTQADLTLQVSQAGVALNRRPASNLDQLMSIITQESLMTKLIKTTFEASVDSLGDFTEKYFVGYSTAKRHVKQMQARLALYGIRYSSASNALLGDEAMVRLCYYRIYWETYSRFEWPFDQFEQSAVTAKVQRWADLLKIQLDELTRLQLSYWVVICQRRQQLGKLVIIPTTTEQARLRQTPLSQLPSIFETDSANETSFFYYCALFFSQAFDADDLAVTGDVAAASELATRALQQQFRTTTTDEQLVAQLNLLHSYTMIFPVGGLLLDRDSIAGQLKQTRPWLIDAVNELLQTLKRTNNPVFNNQVYLRAQYLPVVLTFFDTTVLNPELRVRLMIDATPIYRQWVAKQLNRLLQERYKVKLVAPSQPCDLIITNATRQSESVPVIVINTPMTAQDQQHLQQFQR